MDITIEITVTETAGPLSKKRSKSVVVSIPGFLMDVETDDDEGADGDGSEDE